MARKKQKLRWLPLDNAAKIYPAARRKNWSNVFRLSATLVDAVEVPVLEQALAVTVRRFPSISVRLRRGVFWYYLQELEQPPAVMPERSYPLVRMTKAEMRRCALRVLVYENRIAVEFFHSLTDGTGGLIFLKSLVAEYLQQRYGVQIPAECGVLDRSEAPKQEEWEDSFQKYAAPLQASRRENTAWHLRGEPCEDDFLHLTCMILPVRQVLEKAHSYGVSLTAFLCAAMLQALQNLQAEKVPQVRRRRPLKVLIPVNLRRLFPSQTLRNFAMYTTPELLPRLGQYSFSEICQVVHHHMASTVTAKRMGMMIATNVASERLMAVRLLPLFVKNLVMKAVFDTVGECKSCLSLSNLGQVQLPQAMLCYVQRMDFILGVQATAPYNCGVLSFGDQLYINFIRNTRHPELEYHFFRVLQAQGLQVCAESNERE